MAKAAKVAKAAGLLWAKAKEIVPHISLTKQAS